VTVRVKLSSHFPNGLPVASVSSNLTLFKFPPVKRSVKVEHEYPFVDRSGPANIKGSFMYTPPVASTVASSCSRRVASAITVLFQQEVSSFMAKKCVGDVVGDVVGEMVGAVVGNVVGEIAGDAVGAKVGDAVETVGDTVGETVGDSEIKHCKKSTVSTVIVSGVPFVHIVHQFLSKVPIIHSFKFKHTSGFP